MKQAVVLIHGVGEQVPMDTLRGFVNTVWTTDTTLRRPDDTDQVWSKPDDISRNFELRRLTTVADLKGIRTDFFEFYWAHLMEGTTLSQVWAWIKVLLLRNSSRVPEQLRGIWWFVWIFGAVLAAGWANHKWGVEPAWLKYVWIAGHVLWLGVSWFLIHYAGDAAVYLHVAPANIEKRRLIREAGVQLLQSLHEAKNPDGTRKYSRIIVAGHSLGTVIGYDVLSFLWARYHDGHGNGGPKPVKALTELENLARQARAGNFNVYEYQAAQAAYLSEIQAQGNQWIVTDFVTMGSPLAHAMMLMAPNAEEFDRKKLEREFPTCPPVLEVIQNDPLERFSFLQGKTWVPHHGAVFAPTRWTNLYFPCSLTLFGDFIGGPVAPAFGPGVRDRVVRTCIRCGVFSHTLYWSFPPYWYGGKTPTHIQALREAVRIL